MKKLVMLAMVLVSVVSLAACEMNKKEVTVEIPTIVVEEELAPQPTTETVTEIQTEATTEEKVLAFQAVGVGGFYSEPYFEEDAYPSIGEENGKMVIRVQPGERTPDVNKDFYLVLGPTEEIFDDPNLDPSTTDYPVILLKNGVIELTPELDELIYQNLLYVMFEVVE